MCTDPRGQLTIRLNLWTGGIARGRDVARWIWRAAAVMSMVWLSTLAHGQESTGYIGTSAWVLEGPEVGRITAKSSKTSPRRLGAESIRLLDLGNDGQWHWIALKDVSTMFGDGYLELATTQIDSVVFLSSCDGVVKDVERFFGVQPRDERGLSEGQFSSLALGWCGSVRRRCHLPRPAVGQAVVGAFAHCQAERTPNVELWP